MKLLLILLLSCSMLAAFSQVSIYNQKISAPNAQAYSINSYKGQIIMIVILPTTQTATDSAFLKRIDSVTLAHKGQLKTIAVPSYDDGYVADSANTLVKWYQAALDPSILLSQPIYTHKISAAQQNSLFSWLTNSNQNIHFDYDIRGAGMMFFINGTGQLYGVFGPEAMFSDKVMHLVFQ